jgi:hypothetical protein
MAEGNGKFCTSSLGLEKKLGSNRQFGQKGEKQIEKVSERTLAREFDVLCILEGDD